MKLRYAISLVVMVFITSLLVNAPAALLVGPMAQQNVFLEGVSGSVWHGRAQNLSARANGEVITWGHAEWRLSPWNLLLLSPSVEFSTELGNQWMRGQITLTDMESVQLSNVQGRIPAALVRLFAPLSVGGSLAFDFPRLTWSQTAGVLALTGSIRWVDAVWQTQVDRVRLGTYLLALDSSSEEIVGSISTVQGAVQVAGELRAKQQNYSVDILIDPSGPAQERLRQTLSLLAQQEGRALRIKLSGQY